MEKLLEQAQKLVADLKSEKEEEAKQKAVLDKQAELQAVSQNSMEDFKFELVGREAKILPIENAQKIIESAAGIKADADLQASKVAGEWGALKTAKENFKIEQVAGSKDIEDKLALYNRGAKENKESKEKLDKKLKTIQELKV